MAPPRRSQPPRACRHPALSYYEPALEEIESDDADSKSGTKRKRNHMAPRATSPEETTQPEPVRVKELPDTNLLENEEMWSSLPQDLVECILSRLPVYKLWDTVMSIRPTRWLRILHANGCTNVLGHGKHVDSTIGYIKSYPSTTYRLTNGLIQGDDLCPPPPRVLEHTTKTWQSLPRYPEPKVGYPLKVQSISEGLILMVIPKDGTSNPRYIWSNLYHRMVIWNPVSQSNRYLPRSAFDYNDPNLLYCLNVVVVDPGKTSYKVIELVQSVVPAADFQSMVRAADPTALGSERRRRRVFHPPHPPQLPEQKKISGYAVYDSASASWGSIQPQPRNISQVLLNSTKNTVSCEGCVCFVSCVRLSWPGWELPVGLVCYDSTTNAWSEVLFPTKFFDNNHRYHAGCVVNELLYARGKVYMIYKRSPKGHLNTHYIVSIALVDIQSGVPAFQPVGRVREACASIATSGRPHPPPKCFWSKPNELIVQRPCASFCEFHWYMLPVGITVYLGVVLCNKWHKRFDLDAGMWTDLLMKVPSETEYDKKATRSLAASGRIHYRDTAFHPYIPGWVNV
ncbi:hypothetical protein KC19_7G167800 [Ceratodon purpureus]|uniref:F-box domain-containing protein n=1 Tax=Ceratodon purpureus TaxID=3225 RepID=A0A8T0H8Y1_CERPU|nr:hypothetical protein KC19_7G167800 [Ceratodon purpureus]